MSQSTSQSSARIGGAPTRLLGHRVVDCSMPIEEHWRFAPTISYAEKDPPGCRFHSTAFSMGAHGFTHVDAVRHISDDGEWMDGLDIQRIMGPASIVDVSHLGDDAAITADDVAGAHVRRGDILLVMSDHESRHPTTTPEYWTASPHMTAEAAEWILAAGVSAVGFDFPQDRGIRSDYVDGWVAGDPRDDWPCHRILLASGIPQIEYLTGLRAIGRDRLTFAAVPLRLMRADGAPVRALAFIDDHQEDIAHD